MKLLADKLHAGLQEYENHLMDATDEQKQEGKVSATFNLGGVTVNAQTVLKWDASLDLLSKIIPTERSQQKSYRWTLPTKKVVGGVDHCE